MSDIFEAELQPYWSRLQKIRGIDGVVAEDRLKREMRYVWDTGRNSRIDPASEAKVIGCVRAIAKTIAAASELVNGLEQLGSVSKNDFDVLFKKLPNLSDHEQFTIDELIFNTRLHIDYLDLARRLLALSVGRPPGSCDEIKPKHKALTNDLLKTVHSAMVSWKSMTGLEVNFAKGVDGKLRPQNEDAYFVFLCLGLVAGLKDPSTANTAVNRMREINTEFEREISSGTDDNSMYRALKQNLNDYEAMKRRKIYDLEP